MTNLEILVKAWRLVRFLRFDSSLPEEYLTDFSKAYDFLTNVLLDCVSANDCIVKPSSEK